MSLHRSVPRCLPARLQGELSYDGVAKICIGDEDEDEDGDGDGMRIKCLGHPLGGRTQTLVVSEWFFLTSHRPVNKCTSASALKTTRVALLTEETFLNSPVIFILGHLNN